MLSVPHIKMFENLELIARQIVEGFILGLHKSPFHGFSVEFAEHRLYNRGDNLKYVDWKVYARKDKMFIKKFEEETNLRACMLIDTSSSMNLKGTQQISKLQAGIIGAACLTELLIKQMDAVGIARFDENIQFISPIKAGSKQKRNIIIQLEQLYEELPHQRTTDLAKSISTLAETLPQRSLVIIFSDFLNAQADMQSITNALQHLKFKLHEVILFQINDHEQELNFEFENRPYEFIDLESNQILKINPNDLKVKYIERMKAYQKQLSDFCFQNRIDYAAYDLKDPVEKILSQYLMKRNKLR